VSHLAGRQLLSGFDDAFHRGRLRSRPRPGVGHESSGCTRTMAPRAHLIPRPTPILHSRSSPGPSRGRVDGGPRRAFLASPAAFPVLGRASARAAHAPVIMRAGAALLGAGPVFSTMARELARCIDDLRGKVPGEERGG